MTFGAQAGEQFRQDTRFERSRPGFFAAVNQLILLGDVGQVEEQLNARATGSSLSSVGWLRLALSSASMEPRRSALAPLRICSILSRKPSRIGHEWCCPTAHPTGEHPRASVHQYRSSAVLQR
jgi:hypothetical protein